VQVVSLSDGRSLYALNAGKLVMPASNMKIVTVAVAAARLGWNFRFETRLETVGSVDDGVLEGDLVVTGTGDPSIGSPDQRGAALFDEWADALRRVGITRVNGRLVGDDRAFDDEPIGAGWAWDYLAAGYAAPSGALSYNEDVAVVRITPGAVVGAPAIVELGPPGHLLDVRQDVLTGAAGTNAAVSFARLPGSPRLSIRGQVPLGGPTLVRTTSVDNPTRYFVEAFRDVLSNHGIGVSGGAWDIDDLRAPPSTDGRTLIDRHLSAPLSVLAGYAMKVSQNFYGETFLKAIGAAAAPPGSAAHGRTAVAETLASWGLATDGLVMYDGSGLSRYDYVTADLIVGVLEHVWQDPVLRGPFAAALPVGGHDGTLEARMRTPELDRRVQAKTGTIANVRALSGFLDASGGDRLAFAMIANNFTAPSAQVDAVMEQALERLAAAR
jgi:serine-type D-Ala-D-Ala carboxypeptidase/endopeptidase (penicillin-binding protein 4)